MSEPLVEKLRPMQFTGPVNTRAVGIGGTCGLILSALLMGGCCFSGPPATIDLSSPGWGMRQGQAVWHNSGTGPELAGELQVATNQSGRVWLQFIKPPLPFVVVELNTNSWRLEIVAQNKKYCGPGNPPERIVWLQLARAMAGTGTAPSWSWSAQPDGTWRLENKARGEWLQGYFAP